MNIMMGIVGWVALANPPSSDGASRLLEQVAQDRSEAWRASALDAGALADRALENGQPRQAVQILQQALERDPEDETLEFKLLEAKEQAGALNEKEKDILEALRRERRAAMELEIGAVRLELLRARARLAKEQWDQAMILAQAQMDRVRQWPKEMDRRSTLQALQTVVDEARARHGAARPLALSDMGADPQDAMPVEVRDVTPASAGPPSKPRSPVPPSTGSAPDSSMPVSTVPASRSHMPDRGYAYLTGAEKRDRVVEAFQERQIARFAQAPGIDRHVMIFPNDWTATSERRSAESRVIYQSPEFVDADGQTKTTVVYDVGDLLVPPARFTPPPNPLYAVQNAADRWAIRHYSQIFNGYPEDLAAGIPLMTYFGGVDQAQIPTDLAIQDRQLQDLAHMVDQILQPGT